MQKLLYKEDCETLWSTLLQREGITLNSVVTKTTALRIMEIFNTLLECGVIVWSEYALLLDVMQEHTDAKAFDYAIENSLPRTSNKGD